MILLLIYSAVHKHVHTHLLCDSSRLVGWTGCRWAGKVSMFLSLFTVFLIAFPFVFDGESLYWHLICFAAKNKYNFNKLERWPGDWHLKSNCEDQSAVASCCYWQKFTSYLLSALSIQAIVWVHYRQLCIHCSGTVTHHNHSELGTKFVLMQLLSNSKWDNLNCSMLIGALFVSNLLANVLVC